MSGLHIAFLSNAAASWPIRSEVRIRAANVLLIERRQFEGRCKLETTKKRLPISQYIVLLFHVGLTVASVLYFLRGPPLSKAACADPLDRIP